MKGNLLWTHDFLETTTTQTLPTSEKENNGDHVKLILIRPSAKQENLRLRAPHNARACSKTHPKYFSKFAPEPQPPHFGKPTKSPPGAILRNPKPSSPSFAVAGIVRATNYFSFRWRRPKPLPVQFLCHLMLHVSTSNLKMEFCVPTRVAVSSGEEGAAHAYVMVRSMRDLVTASLRLCECSLHRNRRKTSELDV